MHAGDPHLAPIDPPARHAIADLADGARLHMGGIGPVIGLGQPERDPAAALKPAEDELLLLRLGPEGVEHGDEGKVTDNRMFILKVIVQAQPPGGKAITDHRHPQVGAILAAILARRGKPPVSGGIGAGSGLAQQVLPLMARQALVLEIGPGIFAAVIEEADIIIRLFERLDLAGDEIIEFGQIGQEIVG